MLPRLLWLVSNYAIPRRPHLGIFYKRLAEALVGQGLDLTVAAFTPKSSAFLGMLSGKWKDYHLLKDRDKINGVKVIRPRYWAHPGQVNIGWPHYFMWKSIEGYLRDNHQNFDLIDAHYALPYGMVARLINKNLNIPYVLTFHGDDVNTQPFVNKRSMRYFQESIRSSEANFAVSQPLCDRVFQISGQQAELTHIGLKLSNYYQNTSFKYQVKKILFVGALIKEKGIPLLVRMIHEFSDKDFKWTIIGEGPDRSMLEGIPNVTLLGSVDEQAVIRALHESDLFFFPSEKEGMPTVLVEAGAASVPIVASAVGGIPDLLDQGNRGYLFENGSFNQARNQLQRALDYPEERLAKVTSLHSYIKDTFDVDVNAQRRITTYQRILESKGSI